MGIGCELVLITVTSDVELPPPTKVTGTGLEDELLTKTDIVTDKNKPAKQTQKGPDPP
jgi:hypothetical protein